MKVLLVTQYFYPENFKSNDIAFELVKRGYEVTVLTGIPNYPQGCFFQGYGLFSKKMEKVQGVKIRRAWLFPRGRGGGGRLALNYFSWAFFASFYAFFLSLFHKYDVVLVHEPSPITQGIHAIIIKPANTIYFTLFSFHTARISYWIIFIFIYLHLFGKKSFFFAANLPII